MQCEIGGTHGPLGNVSARGADWSSWPLRASYLRLHDTSCLKPWYFELHSSFLGTHSMSKTLHLCLHHDCLKTLILLMYTLPAPRYDRHVTFGRKANLIYENINCFCMMCLCGELSISHGICDTRNKWYQDEIMTLIRHDWSLWYMLSKDPLHLKGYQMYSIYWE